MQTDTDTSVIEDPAVALDPPEGTDTSGETPAGAEHAEGGAPGGAPGGEDDLDGVVVTIGDEQPAPEDTEQSAPTWVKDLRKANRQKDRELREKDAEIARLRGAGQQQQAVVLGTKPTLESCDFDGEKFETELTAWHDRKRTVEQQAQQAQEAEAKARSEWQKRLDAFAAGKTALKVRDYDDAEASVQEHFNTVQQGVILDGAENAALLVYALGKNPGKAKELAAITNPVRFAFAVAKLEAQLKVTERRAAPVPERVLRGNAPAQAFTDKKLEELRQQGLESGNMDRYFAAKRAAQAKRA